MSIEEIFVGPVVHRYYVLGAQEESGGIQSNFEDNAVEERTLEWDDGNHLIH